MEVIRIQHDYNCHLSNTQNKHIFLQLRTTLSMTIQKKKTLVIHLRKRVIKLMTLGILIQMLQMRTMMLQPTMIKTISNGPAGSDH
jgi:hypothetical protein